MKEPPIAKVYEALTAIASKRVTLNGEEAIVSSSNALKEYKVKWKENKYTSNDNATYWQGYPGYPVIAVLLLKGEIPYDETILPVFKNINWHALNEQFKRDYDASIHSFLETIKEGKQKEKVQKEVEQIFTNLIDLKIQIVRKL